MILKTRNFARWARKAGLNDSLLKMAVLEIQRDLLEAEIAKDLLGLTAAQIEVALGEGSLVEVEHEA